MSLNITALNGTRASAVPLRALDRHGERRYEAGKSAHNNGLCLHWQSLALFSLGSAGQRVCMCVCACLCVSVCGPCADRCRTQLGQSPVSQRGYNEILNHAKSEMRSDLGQRFRPFFNAWSALALRDFGPNKDSLIYTMTFL